MEGIKKQLAGGICVVLKKSAKVQKLCVVQAMIGAMASNLLGAISGRQSW